MSCLLVTERSRSAGRHPYTVIRITTGFDIALHTVKVEFIISIIY